MSRKRASVRRLKSGLTALESRFAAEYVVDFCGKDALIRAGSKSRYPDQQAYEMLRKPHVAKEIEKLIAARNEDAAINAQWVLNELALLYQFNKAAFMAPPEEKGGRRNLAAGKEARACLEKLGDHVNVNAFRKQLGLGNPDGSPIDYEVFTDDELDTLESLLRKAALGESAEADPRGREGGDRETAH